MKNILIATTNENKLIEFGKILSDFKNINILSLKDFEKIEEPIEDGSSFEENSIIKAKYYSTKFKVDVIADDSGLSIKALNNFPSIYSARFAKENGSFENAMNNLKNRLVEKNTNNYSAFFSCVITYYDFNSDKPITFEGIIEGNLRFPPKGENGFGYDPIFIPNGYNMSFGEMLREEKNKISHRAMATQKFLEWLKDNNN